jgi:protein SCO1/2
VIWVKPATAGLPRIPGVVLSLPPSQLAHPTRRAWLGLWPAAALAACGPSAPPSVRGLDISGANYGQDFHLFDGQGRERSLADYRGKLVMLFFGFVQCADVCPAAMFRGAEALKLLGDDGSRIQGLFVTLDPERDTAEIVKAYAEVFHPSFVGLRADLPRTKETAQHFKVYFRKVPGSGGNYSLDHTAVTYVYDTAGQLRLALRAEMSPQNVADDLARLLPAAPARSAGAGA